MAEPLPGSDIDRSQYEAIVEKRWDHYRPRFERFARGGWLSWNWAAFFGTLAWLRYRKLYAWSWGYFFFSAPVFFALVAYGAAGDACERALFPQENSFAYLVLICLFAAGWILPPLAADRIYYNHVRAVIARADRQTGVSGVLGALALQACILILTVASAPSYANYIYRAMVSEGVSMAAGAKTPLAEFLEEHKRLPSKIEDVVSQTSGRYVVQLALEPDGTVRATFGEKGRKLSGYSVSMVPAMKDGRIVAWSCRSVDLPDQCLPAECRRDQKQRAPVHR